MKKSNHVKGKSKKTVMKESKNNIGGLMLVLILVLGIFGGMLYFRLYTPKQIPPTQKEGQTKITPTPIPLHAGPETYTVSQGKHSGPTFTKVIFSPLDPQKGQTLKITVSLNSKDQIKKVTGSLEMDSSKASLAFSQVNGDKYKGDWQAEITMSDTILYTYTLTLSADSTSGVSTIKVSPR